MPYKVKAVLTWRITMIVVLPYKKHYYVEFNVFSLFIVELLKFILKIR